MNGTIRMKWLVCSFIIFTLLPAVYGQNLQIKVNDFTANPLVGSTVKLTSIVDSSKILFTITNKDGIATFSTKDYQYHYIITSVGYETATGKLYVDEKRPIHIVTLQAKMTMLNTVTVKTDRVFIEQEDDKTIVNPESIANSSTSSYEILEKIPGIFLDQNGNIFLSNSIPAVIYINGREQKISTSDIVAILKSLPPNSIDKIEILRSPSSKYDANSTGGIINIILKKGVNLGRFISLNYAMNQGIYGNQLASINFSNSNARKTLYLNLNYNTQTTFDEINTTNRTQSDSIIEKQTNNVYKLKIAALNYGYIYQFTKRLELTYDGILNNTITNNTIGGINQAKTIDTNLALFTISNKIDNSTHVFNLKQGLSLRNKLDTLGSEFLTDIAYNQLTSKNNQAYFTQYNPDQLVEGNATFSMSLQQFTTKIDIVKKLPKRTSFDIGVKLSLLSYHSNGVYVNPNTNDAIYRNGMYSYRETLYSGYIQTTHLYKNVTIKAGLRAEYTAMLGLQETPLDTSYQLKRFNLFPYLFLSKNVLKLFGYQLKAFLIYRRSITRPSYENLSPLPKFLDSYSYDVGNPALRPQYTNNYEFNISVDEKPIFAIGRNYTQDLFTNVVYQDKAKLTETYRTYDNVGINQETYVRVVGAIPPGRRYFFMMGSQFNHNQYEGYYQGSVLKFNRGSLVFFTFHQLKIDQLSTLIVNGYYRLKGQLQFYELSNFGTVNVSINRYFFNKKLLLTLSGSDVFLMNKNSFVLNQESIHSDGFRQSDTRRFGINLKYNFGLRQKEDKINPFNLDSLGIKN